MKLHSFKLFTIAIGIFIILMVIENFTFLGGIHGQQIDEIDPSIQWEFFEQQLLEPEEAIKAYGTGEKIIFPHIYYERYPSIEMYGTYIAKVKLPKVKNEENLAIYVPFEYGSYKLYVNNQFIAKNGGVGTTKAEQVPENAPKIGQIQGTEQEVYITLQHSNFYSLRGGFSKPLYIGPFTKLVNEHNSVIIFHFFINGIIFIAGIFSLLVGLFNNRNKRMILFALFCFIIAVRSLFARPFLYSITIFDVPWHIGVKIEALCTVFAFSIAFSFFAQLVSSSLYKRLFWLAQATLIIQLLLVLFTEPLIFQKTTVYVLLIVFVLLLYLIFMTLRNSKVFTLELATHFVGSIVIFMAAVSDMIVVQQGLNFALLFQHSQVIYVMLICLVISWQYAQKQQAEQLLKNEILALNESLDLKIKERTVQLEKANAALQQLATKDALTGIANRYAFDHHLQLCFEEALQKKNNLSLLLIDLDYFKKYNDHYGHIMGDALLQRVVAVINDHVPPEALFARYGGEEFAIIYPLADEQTLKQLGTKIVNIVFAEQFEHIQHPKKVATISVGGYTMTTKDSFTSIKQLINVSDERLYVAKNNGRNQFIN